MTLTPEEEATMKRQLWLRIKAGVEYPFDERTDKEEWLEGKYEVEW